MPAGVPVATVALDGARNAGILAAQILATSDDTLAVRLEQFKEALKEKIYRQQQDLDEEREE